MKPRILLLASARTYRNTAFTEAAKKLGLEVVLGLDFPPPFIKNTAHRLALDYRDLKQSAETITAYVQSHPVSAILGVDDSGTQLAARAAAALGLKHNAPEAAAATQDKFLMRQRFAAAGVPSPRFHLWRAGDDPEEIAEAIPDTVGFPCVLKPTRLSASKGVMRADNGFEFIERFARLRRILAKEGCDEVLVESFIPGREVALEGLLDAGHLHVLALFDKPDPLDGPFFEETIYVTPSRLPEAAQRAITEAVVQACAALGLSEGPIHAELRLTPYPRPLSPLAVSSSAERGLRGSPEGAGAGGEVTVVEVAARSIGGLCSKTLRFAQGAGASLEEMILRQALGLPLESLEREAQAGGVMMIPIPAAGLLRRVSGLEDARRVPLIEEIEITAPLDNPLLPLPEGDSYLGFIFARGGTPEAVEAALRQAHRCLEFEIVPEIPLEARRK